jgi:hypothetical protein
MATVKRGTRMERWTRVHLEYGSSRVDVFIWPLHKTMSVSLG